MKLQLTPACEPMVEVLSRAFSTTPDAVRQAVLRSYSLNNRDNFNRLRNVFAKAAAGEAVTVAGLGGSITAGASAKSKAEAGNNARAYTEELGGEMCWFDRTVEWFREAFANTQITGVNAGIGSTPSFLGTFRMEQMVLGHQPDLVFVEFSVNDPSTVHNLLEGEIFDAYESVIRKCLETGAAVVQIFMTDKDNVTLQAVHNRIAEHYGIPTVSYANAVYPDGRLICDWPLLSPDDIHPNNAGHAFLGLCISNLFRQVLETMDSGADYPAAPIPESWLYQDTFYKTWAQYAWQLRDSARGAFYFHTDTRDCAKWKGTLVSEGEGTVQVTVPKGAKRVYVQYFHSNGSFETEMAGQRTVCNTVPEGWPRPMWHRIHTGSPLDRDTQLLIRSHASGQAIFLGVLASF